MGKFWEKPLFKMGDINLKKNGSVSLYLKMSGLDSHFMFGGSSISIRVLRKNSPGRKPPRL